MGLLVFFLIILAIGVISLMFLVKHSSHGRKLNQDSYRSDWLKITQVVNKNDQSSLHLAILNADKLLDKALRELGIKGQTMGERLKSADKMWSNSKHVWTAHKLRNRIAHETDVRLSNEITSRALSAFKQALKDLGAI